MQAAATRGTLLSDVTGTVKLECCTCVQCCGGCSILRRLFGTAEAVRYCGVMNSLRGTDAIPPQHRC